MSGSETHRQPDEEGLAAGPREPRVETEQRRASPNDMRQHTETEFSDSGTMTDEILITNGRDADEDETSEGWADRGGI